MLGISSAYGRFHPTSSDFITAGNFIARKPLRTRKLRTRPVGNFTAQQLLHIVDKSGCSQSFTLSKRSLFPVHTAAHFE